MLVEKSRLHCPNGERAHVADGTVEFLAVESFGSLVLETKPIETGIVTTGGGLESFDWLVLKEKSFCKTTVFSTSIISGV